jgi:signal transduction histidine kinase
MQKAYISLSIDIFVNKIQFIVNITYFLFSFSYTLLILSLVFNFVTEQKKIYYMSLNNLIDLIRGLLC